MAVNLHTWTGWGSVPYWNAYVAATEMHGHGSFYDARLNNKTQFPVSARSGSHDTRMTVGDKITDKLAALHYYQLSIPAPKPAAGSFNQAARSWQGVVLGKAGELAPVRPYPSRKHHAPTEVGVD